MSRLNIAMNTAKGIETSELDDLVQRFETLHGDGPIYTTGKDVDNATVLRPTICLCYIPFTRKLA